MTDSDDRGSEGIAHRNPVMRSGYDVVFHVLTLDHKLSDGAFRLYLLLLKYERGKGSCWPGVERLAADLGKSERTIRRSIEELKSRGLITREQRGLGRTAMTWIEDLRTVYGDLLPNPDKNGQAGGSDASPDKNVRADPDKNDQALARTKMTAKQYQEQEQTNNDDDECSSSVEILSNLRITPKTASSLAKRYTAERIRSVCEHALHHGANPAGLAIWMLENDAPVSRSAEADPLQLQECPRCRRMMASARICDVCGHCLDCCDCVDDASDAPQDDRCEGQVIVTGDTTSNIWAENSVQESWRRVLDRLASSIPKVVFDSHLGKSRVLASTDGSRWRVGVYSKASASWLNDRLMPRVESAINQVMDGYLQVEFVALDDLEDFETATEQSYSPEDAV